MRVVIVDDHAMFLESIVSRLAEERGVDVIGAAASVGDALRLLTEVRPDVLVVDHNLPDGSGLELVAHVDAPVVLLTASARPEDVRRAAEAGCAGVLTKDLAVRELVDAVHAAHRGELSIDEPARAVGDAPALSERELDVLRHAARGLSNPAIAEALFLSAHTVKNYMQSAIGKLGAHSKLEAVTIALREGIVRLDG